MTNAGYSYLNSQYGTIRFTSSAFTVNIIYHRSPSFIHKPFIQQQRNDTPPATTMTMTSMLRTTLALSLLLAAPLVLAFPNRAQGCNEGPAVGGFHITRK
jgi:hypothetical protein